MKVLIVGSGGREHAIATAVAKSPKVDKIYCAPGNAGIGQIAECVDIGAMEFDKLVEFAKGKEIDLTVIGMDDPLVGGVVDKFEEAGLRVFGPRKNAAILEGSKAFSKDLMKKYNIPTAGYENFDTPEAAMKYLETSKYPIVLKADGLALGKGVLICNTKEEAMDGVKELMLDKKFGNAGNTIVIEEFMTGREVSVLSFVDGKTIKIMTSAQDHKRAKDGDQGLNTGGMGTVSPNPFLPEGMDEVLKKDILDPFMQGLKEDQMDYRGVVFIGLMIENNQAKVLEFNVRFGDPETQSILLRLESDLYEIMDACATYTLDQVDVKWSDDHVACLVLASGGYPGKYEKGIEIKNIDKVSDDIVVFHAGTALKDGKLVTNGGRVLNVCARGANLQEALAKVYETATIITFDGMYYRHDIGLR